MLLSATACSPEASQESTPKAEPISITDYLVANWRCQKDGELEGARIFGIDSGLAVAVPEGVFSLDSNGAYSGEKENIRQWNYSDGKIEFDALISNSNIIVSIPEFIEVPSSVDAQISIEGDEGESDARNTIRFEADRMTMGPATYLNADRGEPDEGEVVCRK